MIPPHRVDGPPGAPLVVLANSLGTTGDLWGPQMGALSARFRVVRYEHRGHGGTAPPGPYTIDDLGGDVVDLLDHLDAPKASLAGVSLGGMVSMWVAAHHPERVNRLVLACTAAHLPPPDAWAQRAAAVRSSGPRSLLDVLLGRWFTPGFTDRRPDVAALVAAMLDAVDAEGYAGCCEAIGSLDLRSDLAAIAAPTLVVAGADDPVAPPPLGVELQQGIAGAGLVVLPGGAHLANLEVPAAFTAAAVDHLAGGTAAERGDRTRRQVLGDDHVDRSIPPAGSLAATFSDLVTRYAWGDIWTRPGLDLRARSAITLAMLVALGRFDELALHVRAARRNGLSRDEIGEVLLQTAIYCGVPAARRGFAVADEVLADE